MNGNSAFEQAAMFGHRRPKTKMLSIQLSKSAQDRYRNVVMCGLKTKYKLLSPSLFVSIRLPTLAPKRDMIAMFNY